MQAMKRPSLPRYHWDSKFSPARSRPRCHYNNYCRTTVAGKPAAAVGKLVRARARAVKEGSSGVAKSWDKSNQI